MNGPYPIGYWVEIEEGSDHAKKSPASSKSAPSRGGHDNEGEPRDDDKSASGECRNPIHFGEVFKSQDDVATDVDEV